MVWSRHHYRTKGPNVQRFGAFKSLTKLFLFLNIKCSFVRKEIVSATNMDYYFVLPEGQLAVSASKSLLLETSGSKTVLIQYRWLS